MNIINRLLAFTLIAFPCVSNANDHAKYRNLGTLQSEFYRNTAILDRTLAKETWLWTIPEWMHETDFPYEKKPYRTEAPFADSLTIVRLLGGWKNPDLPEDRKNDENDLAGRDETGEIFYRWDLLRARLDPYVSRGYELTLVMDNIPYCFPEKPSQGTFGQAASPKDFDEWGTFIREMCIELKRLYGEETANQFRFRMGTEMQDERRFQGTLEDYLKYYDYAAAAVKEILPKAGFGPFNRSMPHGNFETFHGLVAGNVSILKVVDHCINGTNLANGLKGSPMDFLARSLYYFSGVGENGELVNIQPDERLPEFERLWDAADEISPQSASLSREVHEYGPHLQTEEGIYGLDTGARGAAQNLDTLIGLLEIGTDRVWHWATLEEIDDQNFLLMSNGWLYSIFDRMCGGKLFSIPVSNGSANGNRQRALISVKEDEAILVISNWNIDRTSHDPNTVTLEIPRTIMPMGWKPSGMLLFNEKSSVYDVIRKDLSTAGLLSEKHIKHRGEPATTVAGRGYNSMALDDIKGKSFVLENWDKYHGLMRNSLRLRPISSESQNILQMTCNDDSGVSNAVRFIADCPSVTVVVFHKSP